MKTDGQLQRDRTLDVATHALELQLENERLRSELAVMTAAARAAFDWSQTDIMHPNGDFNYFAENVVPQLADVLGLEVLS